MASRQYALQQLYKSQGLCVKCGQLAVTKDYCQHHREWANAYTAKRLRNGRPPSLRMCHGCGQKTGHNIRTCPGEYPPVPKGRRKR